jgi:hypothetical protein
MSMRVFMRRLFHEWRYDRAVATARELRTASRRELRGAIVHGHPIDPDALAGWVYRGTSLGLPDAITRFTWRTFQKAFHRAPSGRLLGWNVRLEQDGLDAPSRPKLRAGRPVTEWNYEVIAPDGVPMPAGFDRGLVIDYGRAPNPPGPLRWIKDPLVALRAGSADELIGVSYLVVGGRCVETPTYFTLEREAPVDFVPFTEPAAAAVDPRRLTATERAWAEALFASLIGADGGGRAPSSQGLPDFATIDRGEFWRAFDRAASPLVRAGLRPMVYALTFLAVTTHGRPFYRLDAPSRAEAIAAAARHPAMFVRQSLAALQTLACLAYFDDPQVRARSGAAR